MPDSYYRKVVKEELGKDLGPLNSYGSGIIFTPRSESAVKAIKEIFQAQAERQGLEVIGWRHVQTG